MSANVSLNVSCQRLLVTSAIIVGTWLLLPGCSKEPIVNQVAEVRGEPISSLTNVAQNAAPLASSASTVGIATNSDRAPPAATTTPAVEPQADRYQVVGFDRLSRFSFE